MSTERFIIQDDVLIRYDGPGGDVDIPAGITGIGDEAFAGCVSLTSVSIPEGVRTVGDGAFACCEHLTDVSIPEGVRTIGDNAFMFCEILESVSFPSTLEIIGNCAFAFCGNLTATDIPDGVTEIGHSAFAECVDLTGISVPGNIKTIDSLTFSSCRNLEHADIKEGVTRIGKRAFRDCECLTDATIPSSIEKIDESAFSGCYALISIYFAGTREQWEQIGGNAMLEANGLTYTSVHFADDGKGDTREDGPVPSTEEAIRHLEKHLDGDCYTDFHKDVCRLAIEALRERQAGKAQYFAAVIRASAVRDVQCATVPDAEPADDAAWEDCPEAEVFLGFFHGPDALTEASKYGCTAPENVRLVPVPEDRSE